MGRVAWRAAQVGHWASDLGPAGGSEPASGRGQRVRAGGRKGSVWPHRREALEGARSRGPRGRHVGAPCGQPPGTRGRSCLYLPVCAPCGPGSGFAEVEVVAQHCQQLCGTGVVGTAGVLAASPRQPSFCRFVLPPWLRTRGLLVLRYILPSRKWRPFLRLRSASAVSGTAPPAVVRVLSRLP